MKFGKWLLFMIISICLDLLDFVLDGLGVVLEPAAATGIVLITVVGIIWIGLGFYMWKLWGVLFAIIDLVISYFAIGMLFPSFCIAGILFGIFNLIRSHFKM